MFALWADEPIFVFGCGSHQLFLNLLLHILVLSLLIDGCLLALSNLSQHRTWVDTWSSSLILRFSAAWFRLHLLFLLLLLTFACAFNSPIGPRAAPLLHLQLLQLLILLHSIVLILRHFTRSLLLILLGHLLLLLLKFLHLLLITILVLLLLLDLLLVLLASVGSGLSVSFWLHSSAVRIISLWLRWLILLLTLARWRILGLILSITFRFDSSWTLVIYYNLVWSLSLMSILLPIAWFARSLRSFLNVTLLDLEISTIWWWLSLVLAFAAGWILAISLLFERVFILINVLRIITLSIAGILQTIIVLLMLLRTLVKIWLSLPFLYVHSVCFRYWIFLTIQN